jgi:hypothetical protein
MNKWVKYSLWLFGMFVLLFVVFRVEAVVYQTASETFNVVPEIWIVSFISVVMGAYLSLLFISGKLRVNVPLLVCIFLPSTLLGFYYPAAYITTGLHIPLWLPEFDHHGLFHIVSGLSLMMALFNGKK